VLRTQNPLRLIAPRGGFVGKLRLVLAVVAAMLLVAVPAPQLARASDPILIGDYVRVVPNKAAIRAGAGPTEPLVYRMYKNEIAKVVSGPYGCPLPPAECTRGWYEVQYRKWSGFMRQDRFAYTGLAGTTIAARNPRIVVVSLARQQLEAYENGILVLVTPVTTGRRYEPELVTPTGRTEVLAKLSPYTFHSPWPEGHRFWYPDITVRYAIRFREGGYYLHDTPSRTRGGFGYGTDVPHEDPDGVTRDGSRGCINMPVWAVTKLWGWIVEGDPVKVIEG